MRTQCVTLEGHSLPSWGLTTQPRFLAFLEDLELSFQSTLSVNSLSGLLSKPEALNSLEAFASLFIKDQRVYSSPLGGRNSAVAQTHP